MMLLSAMSQYRSNAEVDAGIDKHCPLNKGPGDSRLTLENAFAEHTYLDIREPIYCELLIASNGMQFHNEARKMLYEEIEVYTQNLFGMFLFDMGQR
jgi:hypothetical protein